MCEVTQLNTISIIFISCGTSWENCVFSHDFIIIAVHRPVEDTLYKLNTCSYLKSAACLYPYWSNSSFHQLMFMRLVITMNVLFNQQVKATLKERQVQCEQILLGKVLHVITWLGLLFMAFSAKNVLTHRTFLESNHKVVTIGHKILVLYS